MPRVLRDFRREVTLSDPKDSLVASARVYSTSQAHKLIRKTGRRTNSRAWQELLWGYYDTIPEYRSGCDWVGNALSRAKLEVYKGGQRVDTPDAQAAIRGLFGGSEGQEEMLRLLGVNYTVAGEAFIHGTPAREVDDEDDWKVVSAVEVSAHTDGTRITIEGEDLADDELAIRLWKSHPRRTDEANSPSRAVLPILAEIEKLTQVIDAQADSRLTSAGILWVPSEMELPTVTITAGEGDDETTTNVDLNGADGLYNQLVTIASIAIEKRDSAAAKVPIVISAPGEYLEKIQHTEFWSGFDDHVKDLRDEAIRRIAVGMDMPPEVLLGTAEVNHWGAWQIEEAAIKQYTEPLLNIITADLSAGYLRPLLRGWGVVDADEYSFHADTSQMRLRPNRSKESVELWDRGALNTRTLLIENGFDPEVDMMDDAERRTWLLLKVAGGSATPDQVAAALGQLGVQGMPAELEEETREARPTRSLEQHPDRSAPDPEDSESAEALLASAQPFVVDGLVLATEQMVWRCLERAGNKLKNRVGDSGSVAAMDLYLTVPSLSMTDCERLLEDAWTTLDRFSYPGVATSRLRQALNTYAMMLLRMQKPHSRAALAKHLLIELAEAA